jgi:uncharacterized protein (TIGR03435 family)
LAVLAVVLAGTVVSAQMPPAPPPAGRVTVRELMLYAYDLLPYQLVDAPAWTATERFPFVLTIGPADQLRPRELIQRTLADRFALRVRREKRELATYALRFAEDDKRPGPQLKLVPEPDVFAASFGEGAIMTKGIPWGFLHPLLGASLGRVVVDETGITGPVDLALEWTADFRAAQEAGSAAAVDIFTALYEQLGLMLASTRGPVDVVVVESVSRPTN